MTSLTVALTADLHWGNHGQGDDATRLLVSFLEQQPPDLFLLAGDVGSTRLFAACLDCFTSLPCRKALIPGNHDIWVHPDSAIDSLTRYEEELPRISREKGFHYLDLEPLVLPEHDLAIVGSINWYDYSWALEPLQQRFPEELHRLQSKRFTRGRHNDANYVRMPFDDAGFTAHVVDRLERHLGQVLEQVGNVIVVVHHPPFYGISFPRLLPPATLDTLLWDAFAGNRRLEEVLRRHAERIRFAFCGHTHRVNENTFAGIRGYNVGSDYHCKRLLWLDWPAGTVTAHKFGESEQG